MKSANMIAVTGEEQSKSRRTLFAMSDGSFRYKLKFVLRKQRQQQQQKKNDQTIKLKFTFITFW